MLEVCAVMQVAHVSTLNLFAYKSLIGVTFPPPLCVTSRRDGWASTLRSKPPQMVLKGKMNRGRGDRLTNVSDFKAVLRPVIVCVRERSRIITVPLRKCCW